MDTTKTEELYNGLQAILERGSEEEARAFIDAHANEFPEEVQQKIALALFEEALEESSAARALRNDLQKQGLDAVARLDSGQRSLEDQMKIKELKEKLNEHP